MCGIDCTQQIQEGGGTCASNLRAAALSIVARLTNSASAANSSADNRFVDTLNVESALADSWDTATRNGVL